MKLEEVKKSIEKTNYWDLLVLDVQLEYFGDELYIYIENNNEFCWEISFLSCYKVSYQTDANWRGDFKVKDTGPHSGYFAQDIAIGHSKKNEDFFDASIDLSIMTMNVVCKNITVKEVPIKDKDFFWKDKD